VLTRLVRAPRLVRYPVGLMLFAAGVWLGSALEAPGGLIVGVSFVIGVGGLLLIVIPEVERHRARSR
jgi:hypothetical protein